MTNVDRRTFIRKPFVLPADVLVFPVTELAEQVRLTLDCSDEDFAVTRPGFRSYSRIVDRETAALLEEFRQPKPIAEAILSYSVRHTLEPQELLEKAFPVLLAFSEALLLVPADSAFAEGIEASFAPGQTVAGYEVRRLIQSLEDTELYQVKDSAGTTIALKITRPDTQVETLLALRREAAILEHLSGICCPRLIKSGSFRDRTFVASSWLSGVPISVRAQELRLATTGSWREQLHALCGRLIDAYHLIHERGIVHGDIHPRNTLVGATETVSLLDFGLSRFMVGRPEFDHSRRAGIAWFMEPEVAEPLYNGINPPPAGYLGEQYALATLVYYLICGEHYLDGVPEPSALYRQIIEEPPPPFARRGFESWPEVEAVLARAMAKSPEHRFSSMTAFRDAFQQAKPPEHQFSIFRSELERSFRRQVEEILERTVRQPRSFEELFPAAPTSSAQFGAAGLVWFLYRASQIREDSQLIAAADLWSRRTLSRLAEPDAFEAPAIGITEQRVSPSSFYYRRSGVHCIQALVSHARGDISTAAGQAQQFIETSKVRGGSAELSFGRSGILVGGSLLLDVMRWSSRLDAEPLAAYLREEAENEWEHLSQLPDIGKCPEIPHLGMAHGWAGILYAQLLIHRTLRATAPANIQERLAQLAALAEPAGRGYSWIGTIQHPGQETETPSHAPGWCSGSGGHLFLWALAYEMFHQPSYLDLAEKAAWHTWEHGDRHPRLCCGLAGRSFALLRFYRLTGQQEWLVRAQQLAGFAFSAQENEIVWEDRTLSLYWGVLGPALLAIELEEPEHSAMPVFDSEVWPLPEAI